MAEKNFRWTASIGTTGDGTPREIGGGRYPDPQEVDRIIEVLRGSVGPTNAPHMQASLESHHDPLPGISEFATGVRGATARDIRPGRTGNRAHIRLEAAMTIDDPARAHEAVQELGFQLGLPQHVTDALGRHMAENPTGYQSWTSELVHSNPWGDPEVTTIYGMDHGKPSLRISIAVPEENIHVGPGPQRDGLARNVAQWAGHMNQMVEQAQSTLNVSNAKETVQAQGTPTKRI